MKIRIIYGLTEKRKCSSRNACNKKKKYKYNVRLCRPFVILMIILSVVLIRFSQSVPPDKDICNVFFFHSFFSCPSRFMEI